MAVQRELGSDIVMIFDDCTPYPADEERRAPPWSSPCAGPPAAARPTGTTRRPCSASSRGACTSTCARRPWPGCTDIGFDGYAVGGLSVGSPRRTAAGPGFPRRALAPDRPRYLMGVGTPRDIVEAVRRGIDMFDCVMPTRNARNGYLFTHQGVLKIRNARTGPTRVRSTPVATATPAELQPRLPASPGQVQRDPGLAAQHDS